MDGKYVRKSNGKLTWRFEDGLEIDTESISEYKNANEIRKSLKRAVKEYKEGKFFTKLDK